MAKSEIKLKSKYHPIFISDHFLQFSSNADNFEEYYDIFLLSIFICPRIIEKGAENIIIEAGVICFSQDRLHDTVNGINIEYSCKSRKAEGSRMAGSEMIG